MALSRKRLTPLVRVLSIVIFASISFWSAGTPSQSQETKNSELRVTGFGAVITGSYEGDVSGTGVLKLLPDAGFEKQGYFFLADSQGIRPHGVTFVLPRGIVPGHYVLESPSPLDIGNVPSVRVDKDTGIAVISADKKTSGFIELNRFPTDETALSGSDVKGRFEFDTEDLKGQRITVKGSFSFKVN